MVEVNKCAGWTEYAHETNEVLTLILFDGCEYCGGLDCGDTADVIKLCRICLGDLKNSTVIDRWKILEDEENPTD